MISARLALHECPLQGTAALAALFEFSSKHRHIAKALQSNNIWTQTCCSESMTPVNLKSNFLWYKGEAIVSKDSSLPLVKSKREGRFSEPRWEVVSSGTSKVFDREEPVSETNIPCGRYKSCFLKLVTHLHFTVLAAPQDLSQQKSVSKVPLTLMGSKQVLNCTWPQNSSRQRSSPAQHSSQTQPKLTKAQTWCCGKRPEQPDHEEQSRKRIMKKHQDNLLLINSFLYLFARCPLGNNNNCWKSYNIL